MIDTKTRSTTDTLETLTVGENEADHTPTRREFLQVTAAGAVAAAFLGTACGDNGDGPGGDDGPDSDGPGRDTEGATPPPGSRVVRVVDSAATSWSPGDSFDDFYQYGVQSAVDAMLDRGLLALTGAASIEAAWQALISYNEGDLVAIQPNVYNSGREANRQKNNVFQPLSAIVRGLVDVLGIPPANIAVSDPSRTLLGSAEHEARLINECFRSSELSWDLYRGEYDASAIPFTAGHEAPSAITMARLLVEADHVILFPVLSWHSFGWITGAMKVVMGAIRPMGDLHPGGESNYEWRDGSRLADICMPIKQKLRLVVTDGLFGNIEGNSGTPHAFETLGGDGGNHPSSTLYLSRDLVAVDCVMYDDLLGEAKASGQQKNGYRYGYLKMGADEAHQLGTYEMRDETGSDGYSDIDLVDA